MRGRWRFATWRRVRVLTTGRSPGSALDGTKLEANASKHKAMSYARLIDKEQQVEAEIASPPPAA